MNKPYKEETALLDRSFEPYPTDDQALLQRQSRYLKGTPANRTRASSKPLRLESLKRQKDKLYMS